MFDREQQKKQNLADSSALKDLLFRRKQQMGSTL